MSDVQSRPQPHEVVYYINGRRVSEAEFMAHVRRLEAERKRPSRWMVEP